MPAHPENTQPAPPAAAPRRAHRRRLAGVTLALLAGVAGQATAAGPREWHFTVYFDTVRVGEQHYRVTPRGPDVEVETEAELRLKILGIDVYRYHHRDREVWRYGCLQRISTSSDVNGRRRHVEGNAGDKGLALETHEGRSSLPGCVRTFAYWDAALLDHPHLLDAVNGDLLPSTRAAADGANILVRGESVPARRHVVTTPKTRVEVWYSATGEWIGLDTTTDSGRKLRYRIEAPRASPARTD